MSTVSRGASFEHRIMRKLQSYGWKVFRSAGSHSCSDLIAFKHGHTPLWIQCKASAKLTLSKKEKGELSESKSYGAINICIYRNGKNHRLLFATVRNSKIVKIKEPRWLKTLE